MLNEEQKHGVLLAPLQALRSPPQPVREVGSPCHVPPCSVVPTSRPGSSRQQVECRDGVTSIPPPGARGPVETCQKGQKGQRSDGKQKRAAYTTSAPFTPFKKEKGDRKKLVEKPLDVSRTLYKVDEKRINFS